MERLTYEIIDGGIVVDGEEIKEFEIDDNIIVCGGNAILRLSAYEDTGLEPSQIANLQSKYALLLEMYDKQQKEVKEYKQKLADGRIIELPECYIDTIIDWLCKNEYGIKLACETKLMTIFEELAEELIEKLKEREG